MARVPDDIPGLGMSNERCRPNPQFDISGYQFDQDSYFLWSRFDGHTSTRDVILMVGMPTDKAIRILQSLRSAGALLRPGETPNSVERLLADARARQEQAAREQAAREQAAQEQAAREQAAQEQAAQEQAAREQAQAAQEPVAREEQAPTAEDLDPDEQAAMAADVDLAQDFKMRVIAMRRKARDANYFELFDLPRDVDKRTLKRVYFKLSKEFHPDRYYGKNTGPFAPWLADVFNTISGAFKVLGNKRERKRYEAELDGQDSAQDGAQSREDYAADLFQRACNSEMQGQMDEALKLFAAAIKLDPTVRYLTRAARCATAANALEAAETYAHEAHRRQPDDPSIARVVADVYRQAGKLQEAADILRQALSIKNENDRLVVELQRDLEEVEAALTGS